MKLNMMKRYLFSFLCLLMCLNVFSQDPLAPAVGPIEESSNKVIHISETVVWILMGFCFVGGIYFFVSGSLKAGFAMIGVGAIIGSIVLAVLGVL